MELKIEHLAGYLPYGLKFQGWDGKTELCAIMLNRGLQIKASDMHNNAEMISLSKNMPVLIPLDKLTREQLIRVGDIITGGGEPDASNEHMGRFFLKENGYSYDLDLSDSIAITTYLYSIKADIRGLCTAGLAIDATTLETNPYQ